jgi:zinc transport system substrate-binding protein
MSRLGVFAAAVALLVPAVAGCGLTSTDGRPEVVASFYPLQYVAEQVVGDHASVLGLTEPGAEPHDLELTVRQTALVSRADVGLFETGLQPAVDEVVRTSGPRHVVEVTSVVPLRPPPAGDTEERAGDLDPHFWLDPTLLARVARAFTDRIVAVDPAHAAAYRANDAALQARLAGLDADFRAGLAHCRVRTVVVSHDAFEYLGRRYHLDVVPIAGLSPDAEPSPRHLAALSDLVRTDHVTTVFSERLASPKLARTLAHDLGLRTAVLDPVEGLASSDGTDDYVSLMRANLAALERAGGCS